jgi:hypothetical protein
LRRFSLHLVEFAFANGCKSDEENTGKTRFYTPIIETKYTVDGICNTYATRVTRATVDEFCPGFSAFGFPFCSMHIAFIPNTAF